MRPPALFQNRRKQIEQTKLRSADFARLIQKQYIHARSISAKMHR